MSPMRQVLRSGARRAGWVLSDQALSSITNFGLALVVVRTVPTRHFGAYTVSIASYFVALGLCRGLCGEPQVVRYSHVERGEWIDATKSSTGLALMIGIVGGVVTLISAWMLGGVLGTSLVPLGVLLPGLLLQDTFRYAFFSSGEPAKSFANDLVWTTFQVGTMMWVLHSGNHSVGTFIFAWGSSASLAGLVGCAQAGLLPSPRSSFRWLRLNRDLWPHYAAEYLLGTGTAQCVFFGVGIISGLAAVGTLNAGRVVLGPFNILALGAVGFAVPEGVRILRRRPDLLMPKLVRLGGCLGILGLACGGAVLLLPESVGEAIVGLSWPMVREVTPLMTIFVAATGVTEAARVGLRVFAMSRRSLAAQGITAPLVVIGATVGAFIEGANGAAGGLAVSHCVASWIWWRQLGAANREALARWAGEADTPGSVRSSPAKGEDIY